MKRFSEILFTSMVACATIGCSGVKFDKPADGSNPANSASSSTPQSGDSASGAINQPGGGTTTIPGAGPNGGDVSNSGDDATGVIVGNGNAPAAQLPKVRFIGPPCQRLTNCVVTFQLDKAYPYTTEFDWRTNDALFGTSAQAGLPPWGKPGFPGDLSAQYVPTSGHVAIPAGQTEATVYVRNINQQDVPISIGVLMSSCAYQSLFESCQKFFSN